ncbi:MAG: DUF6504 family protein [Candidatus Velthaea sp.]
MTAQFVSEPIVAEADAFDPRAISAGEPALPPAFVWRERSLRVAAVRKTWRSLKEDRGEMYLKRHYFELELADGAVAVVYFQRQAKRGAARWFLYTIDEGEKSSTRTKNA